MLKTTLHLYRNIEYCRTAYSNSLFLKCLLHQLLRGVTISNGGVLPRIHPELLSKKRGGRVKVDSQASVSEKQEEHSKSKKPIKTLKKVKGKRGRKPKVNGQNMQVDWDYYSPCMLRRKYFSDCQTSS